MVVSGHGPTEHPVVALGSSNLMKRPMTTIQLRIGELAELLELPVETIRYYEREGLMPPPRRTDGNYSVYDTPLADRLTFMSNCRALDMTPHEIRELLRHREAPEQDCTGATDVRVGRAHVRP